MSGHAPALEFGDASTRRLSPLRVALAAIITVGLAAGAFFGVTAWASANAPIDAGVPWFAGYVDVTATPTYSFETPADPEKSDAVLSFIVSSPSNACTPSWGGADTLDQASASLDLDRRIARLQQAGGSIAVSFGGQRNEELAIGCEDATSLKAAYASVLDRYHVGTIDLDLEGAALTDTAAGLRRAQAIAELQKERRASGNPLAVWATLPVSPQGMTTDGTSTVSTLLDAGVDLAGINLMTMDYGAGLPKGTSLVDAAKNALTESKRQLGVLYHRAGVSLSDRALWAKIGATPMIGQNDVKAEVFTLDDAKALNAWAVGQKIGRMSMWSANRDKTCGSNYVATSIVSDACSGVDQNGVSFASVLARGFSGSLALGEASVTTSEPTDAADATDNPSTSPYSIWADSSSYLKGTKVVWHRNVYEAKWWTRGDLPDNPVLNSWETPWQLIGPVLPGEKPIAQATLPAGTYATWQGSSAYQKGARVLFGGVPFEAKWWTQADSPEASSANPDSSPWVPLTQAQIEAVVAGTPDPGVDQSSAGPPPTDPTAAPPATR